MKKIIGCIAATFSSFKSYFWLSSQNILHVNLLVSPEMLLPKTKTSISDLPRTHSSGLSTTDPKNSVHLEDLWMTAYGSQVLLLLGLGLRTDLDGLRKIEVVMERLGLSLTTKIVTEPLVNPKSHMSNTMYSLLMKRAMNNPKKSRKKKS